MAKEYLDHSKQDFFQQIFQVVMLVPKGRVTSYGAIAKYLGAARSSRVVGYAMSSSHQVVPPVPAHRVVNRIGCLTGRGHFSPPESMAERLMEEGIPVIDNQIQDFEKYFWDPAAEL